MTTYVYDVASEADLNKYISQADAAASGSFITLIIENDITLIAALNLIALPSGVSLDINGNSGSGGTYTLDTAGYPGLFVSGDTIVQNLTISNSMDNSTPAVTLAGGELAGTVNISSNAFVSETAQDTFGDSNNSANITNYGTYDIVYNGSNNNITAFVLGISAGNVASNISNRSPDDINGAETFTNYGTLEQTVAKTGTGGTSVIAVDVIDTGTLSVADLGGNEDLLFNGANNSFSGTYIGGGMIDYGYGTNTLGTIDMTESACTTSFGTVNQSGVLTLSSTSTIQNWTNATWNFTTDNGIVLATTDQSAAIIDYGTLAKTGGTGTTVIGVDLNYSLFGGKGIVVNVGNLAFDGADNSFAGPISGAGIVTLGGGGADEIDSSTTITTSAWTITDRGTEVTLEESLKYSGILTVQSGATLTLANDSTLTVAQLIGSDATVVIDAGSSLIDEATGVTYGPGTYDITEFNSPCYCRGTLIRTERGEVPVEALTIGSKVLTKSGEVRPIKWIGRRSYGGRFIMGRKDVLPICIKAGALDDHVPRRDLWLSPHHALYLDGLLIEAKDLVNGVSIVQADRVEKVEYFHIELETHDVIIAEGALAESFIDDDSRGMFSNAHEYRQLYGDVATGLAQFCAPRREEGYQVEAVRRRIALRAGVSAERISRASAGCVALSTASAPTPSKAGRRTSEHPEAPVCLDIYMQWPPDRSSSR